MSIGSGWFFYFAYGSNLYPPRLLERVPSAEALAPAVLEGHRLRFHKLGRDGSAKCDARFTGDPGDRVYGALYRIAERERAGLDRAESLGVGYDAVVLPVRTASATLRVWTYRARDEAIASGLEPFDWYLGYVIAGGRYHGLPEDYVNELTRTPVREDPDTTRRQINQAALRRPGQ